MVSAFHFFATKCSFIGNGSPKSQNALSGGIALEYDDNIIANITLSDSIFEGNIGNCGGVLLKGHREISLEVRNCSFEGNTGINGGGISSDSFAIVTILDSAFKNNMAAENGGAVHVIYGVVRRSRFVSNTALLGGGVEFRGVLGIAEDCYFEGNANHGM